MLLLLLACRDPFLLEKPSAANGWRWRVMVGANVDMEALALQAAAAAEPTAATPAAPESGTGDHAAAAAADVSAVGAAADDGSASGAQGLTSRAEEERQQLRRAAAALAAGGWMGGGRGLPGGLTLGTATVYRSKGRQLEGGEQVGADEMRATCNGRVFWGVCAAAELLARVGRQGAAAGGR